MFIFLIRIFRSFNNYIRIHDFIELPFLVEKIILMKKLGSYIKFISGWLRIIIVLSKYSRQKSTDSELLFLFWSFI